MRSFQLQQHYPFQPSEVMGAMLHPGLHAFLEHHVPDLRSRTELELSRRGDTVERKVRCVPSTPIPDAARHLVKPEMITWVEEARFDLSRDTVSIQIIPAGFRHVFSFVGRIVLEADPGGCRRKVTGEVTIRMPVVGKIVEDYLIEEIRRNMDAEGQALGQFMAKGLHQQQSHAHG